MSQSLFIAFVVFGAVMAFTPGPNNIMVLSSGLTYGFRRSLPHIVGIAIGVSFMVASVGLGVGDRHTVRCPRDRRGARERDDGRRPVDDGERPAHGAEP